MVLSNAFILAFLLLLLSRHDFVVAESESESEGRGQTSSKNASRSSRKPNILLILADDVGTGDIPYYWKENSLVNTPNIDKLSEMGVTFMDAHSTPLCAPSRYMLLSGNYAHRGQVPKGTWSWNDRNSNQFLSGQKSIAEILRDQGDYSTAMFGKWHMGAGVPRNEGVDFNKTHILTDDRHDWSQKIIDGPSDVGFETSLITTAGIQAPPYVFFKDGFLTIDQSDAVFWKSGSYQTPHGTSKIAESRKYEGEGAEDWDSSAYNMILVNETKKFVENHLENEGENPFFAYVALGAVHSPHSPPDNYIDGDPIAGQYATNHLDMLLEMDKVVGSLVSIIEDKNLAEDTIIIFTSDNGGLSPGEGTDYSLGHRSSGPLRGHKALVYEGGHRVPLIFRYDNALAGFPAGQERSHMVGLNDIYATLCDLLGLSVPHFSAQDSVSFAGYISSDNNQVGLRNDFAVFGYERNAQAIRVGNFKLVHNITPPTFELYNMTEDESESTNLYVEGDETYLETMAGMYDKLIEIGPCPFDRVEPFRLSGGSNKGESVSCQWFQDLKSRCDENIEGRLYCNSVCKNGVNASFCRKTPMPISPFSVPKCTDSPDFFPATFPDNRIKNKQCQWAKRKHTGWRCSAVEGVKEACPQTCTNCCEDTKDNFILKHNRASRDCAWAAVNPKLRCRKPPTRQYCSVTCGECTP